MQSADVLVFPTARCPAREIGEDSMATGFQPFFNRAFNVTGNPALSICDGFSAAGLPLALQIGGRPFEDALGAESRSCARERSGNARPASCLRVLNKTGK